MATWREFTLGLVQTTTLIPDNPGFASGKAVAAILAAFPDQFDGEMQVLPLPSEVPPDVPRVLLRSSDDRRRVSMAPARIDSIWSNPVDGPPMNLCEAALKCAEVQERYVAAMHVRFRRLALIVHRAYPVDNPAQALIERFCNEESRRQPFDRSGSFEIHNQKVYALRKEGLEYPVSSWVRCKSAKTRSDSRPVILVEQDLNTLASEMDRRRFDAAQIHAFYEMAATEADQILAKYFPE